MRLCSVKDCGRKHSAKGYCAAHYMRSRAGGDVSAQVGPPRRPTVLSVCSLPDCKRPYAAKGYCRGHWCRWRRGERGEVLARPFRVDRPTGEGHVDKKGYVLDSVEGKQHRRHRLVMEEILGRKLLLEETVHHKNGIRDDNLPENLELWSKAHPPGPRVEDKLRWAKDFIALYEGT
jgi:hypothetical protein